MVDWDIGDGIREDVATGIRTGIAIGYHEGDRLDVLHGKDWETDSLCFLTVTFSKSESSSI